MLTRPDGRRKMATVSALHYDKSAEAALLRLTPEWLVEIATRF
jgi:hypothetical protein